MNATIHPSLKFIQAGFLAVILVIIAALVVHVYYLSPQGQPPWLPAAACVLLLWPIARLIRRRFTRIVIQADKLYYETGALSKQTRIIQIHKIQDVRVHQSLGQRLVGVGDLSIETAGEASRLTIFNIDRPRALAEQLLEAIHSLSPGHNL
ncbi:MAG: PH domain-containing protein [Acidobacteriaceae bacterium]|nr:PH domain-containing protein [Acidobacteriaceae bacterium]